MTFCLTSGQSSADETQRVLLFQAKRRGTVTQTGVSTDETRSGQRGEKQERPLRFLDTDLQSVAGCHILTVSAKCPLKSGTVFKWLEEQPGIRLICKLKFDS